MGAFRLILAGLLVLPSVAMAQSRAEIIKVCGENLKTVAYNTFYTENNIDMSSFDKSSFCSKYNSTKSGSTGLDIGGSFGDISGNLGFTDSQSKAVYKMECSSDLSSAQLSSDFKQSIRTVSSEGLASYEACLKTPNEDVYIELDSFNPKRLGVNVTNYRYQPAMVKSFDTIVRGDVKCVGSLASLSDDNRTLAPRGTLAMICNRTTGADGAIPEVTMLMEVEGLNPWTYNWEGRAACGTKGEQSCTNVALLDRSKKYIEESGGGYDRAGIVPATVQKKKLDTLVQSDVPTVCDASNIDSVKDRLRSKLRTDWKNVSLSSTVGHSCTKGSSGGTKNCGCKYTSPAPIGFKNDKVTANRDGYKRKFVDTRAQTCLKKSGKGKLSGSVTAHWRLKEDEIERRVSDDLAYISARSSCFNGCASGLSVDKKGICR